MVQLTRSFFILVSTAFLIVVSPARDLRGYEVLPPGGGEIIISAGQMEGSFLVAGTGRKYITRCMDLGGSVMAIPAAGSRSEIFFTTEMRYGFWYCCIPRYYVDYLYLSLGAGSYSQMGEAERENAFALSGGTGLRINLLGRFILSAEIKAFSIFRDGGREERVAFLLGGGIPL